MVTKKYPSVNWKKNCFGKNKCKSNHIEIVNSHLPKVKKILQKNYY
jgi:hypothetical protein